MKLLKIFIAIYLFSPAAAHAFIGDYSSTTGYDSAVIAAVIQRSNIAFKFGNDGSIRLNRKFLLIGISKAIERVNLFGGYNYGIDGGIDAIGYDLEKGSAITVGGSYTFIDEDAYRLSGFSQCDYIIEEVYKNSDLGREYSLNGYEVLAGLTGKYSLPYNFSVFSTVQSLLLSGFNEERSWGADYDVEMADTVGGTLGCFYDEESWFLRAEYQFGMGTGFGLFGGMKF